MRSKSPPFILADKRIPSDALRRLQDFGRLILLETKDLVYDAISGHPDIFFCHTPEVVIAAPNIPDCYAKALADNDIDYVKGHKAALGVYPGTASYNAVVTNKYFIGNVSIVDQKIRDFSKNLETFSVKQAYTRCNLLPLNGDAFICSDVGIHKKLLSEGIESLFVDPKGILLPGFEHGFFGGCCGIYGNKVFIIGSLNTMKDGHLIRSFMETHKHEVVELYDGPLFDGGSLLFLDG